MQRLSIPASRPILVMGYDHLDREHRILTEMWNSLKNHSTIPVLALIICCLVTGCGGFTDINILMPRQADLSETETFVKDHINELDYICSEFRDLSVTSVYQDSQNKWNTFNSETKETRLITEEDKQYNDLVRSLSDDHISSIFWWGSDIKMRTPEGEILKSDALPDEAINPFDYSSDKEDLATLNWKKSINGDNITFIADHRLEFRSHWRHMYYRVDMKYVGNGFYVYEIQSKYPLYSYLVE